MLTIPPPPAITPCIGATAGIQPFAGTAMGMPSSGIGC
jgi:hypothetical protein